jgi:hypothetical protein
MLLIAAVAVAGCFDGDEPAAPSYQFQVEVTPPAVDEILQDDALILETEVTNLTTGEVVPGQPVVFRSDDPGVADVFYIDHDDDEDTDDVPVLFAIGGGETIVRARFRGAEFEIPVAVTAVPITSGTITADPGTTAFVGEEIELATEFRDAANNIIERLVEFESSDEDVATVDEDGVVTIVDEGTATITATSDGFSRTIVVTGQLRPVAYIVVTPDPASVDVGEDITFTARLFAANDEELEGRTVTWSTSDATRATIVATTGVATGVATTGTTPVVITATAEGVTGTARLFVDPAP